MEFWDIYDQFYTKIRRFILALAKVETCTFETDERNVLVCEPKNGCK